MKKLELKNLKVKKVSREELSTVNGGGEVGKIGFLSIGYRCSAKNNCDRMHTRTHGWCPYN